MNQKKPTLGRGLADLLGQARPVVPADGLVAMAAGARLLGKGQEGAT